MKFSKIMEDLHNKWSHRWLNPKAKKIDSKIHGWGVMAIEKISKGETIGVLGGIIIPSTEIKTYWKEMGHVGIQMSDDFFIVPSNKRELDEKGVFNHSCDPNCGIKSSIKLVAIKDIEKGEEIVFDYAMNESLNEEFKCNCKSINCRKIIRPTDWKIQELQEKYKDYFSEYIKSKFN